MKKTIIVILTLAFMAGSVGLGIHLLHKGALAIQTYQVYIEWEEDEEWVPLEDATVRFCFWDPLLEEWSEWIDATETDPGLYKLNQPELTKW